MFYSYQGKAYFAPAFYEEVYELTSDSFRVAYRWDMGEYKYSTISFQFESGHTQGGGQAAERIS